MNTPRLISHVCRRPLPSFSTGQWSVRTIATGAHQVKYGNVGGRDLVMDTQSRQLDSFLGQWQLEKMTYHKGQQMPQKPAVKMLSKADPALRTSLAFKKDNDTWTVEIGDSANGSRYNFSFGVDFVMLYPNGKFMQTVIYPEGRLIKWEQQNLDVPSDMLMVITEVKGQKLIWKTKYPDGTKLVNKYARK